MASVSEKEDAGLPMEDAGQPMEDSGQPMEDAGQPKEEAGQPKEDAGQPKEYLPVGDGTVDIKGRPALQGKSGGWQTTPFIYGFVFFELTAFIFLTLALFTYLYNVMHVDVSKAANITTNFAGTSTITSLLGGFIADAYLGRFWMLVIGALIELVGFGMLAISTIEPSLKAPACIPYTVPGVPYPLCESLHRGKQLSFLLWSLYVLALGAGGVRASLASHGADQFEVRLDNLKDRLRLGSYFNYFYMALAAASLVVTTLLVWVLHAHGYTTGFLVMTVCVLVAIACFVAGTPVYRHRLPLGSPLTTIARVFVASFRKRGAKIDPADPTSRLHDDFVDGGKEAPVFVKKQLLSHTNQFRFLDKAALIEDGAQGLGAASRWRLTTVTEVEEVKIIIRFLPICATTIFTNTVVVQFITFTQQQGATMKSFRLGKDYTFPVASLGLFSISFVMVFVAVYDKHLVPLLRRVTKIPTGITPLQRTGVGLFLSAMAMVSAGLVEHRRLAVAAKNGLLDDPMAIVPLSLFWLLPQSLFISVAEAFNIVGVLEFYYQESPEGMRASTAALSYSSQSVGFFISSAIVNVVNQATKHGQSGQGWINNDNINKGHLDYYYYVLAVLALINLGLFALSAHWYKVKKIAVDYNIGSLFPDLEAEKSGGRSDAPVTV